MAAQKKTKKKTLLTLASTDVSPCERGDEIKNLELTIRAGEPLALFFQVCAGVGQVVSHLADVATSQQRLIGEATGVGDDGVSIPIPTSSMPPGRYMLTWTFRIDGDDPWTTVNEMQTRNATVFRLYKRREGNRPVTTLFMIIGITP